jgi:hypothetical protein
LTESETEVRREEGHPSPSSFAPAILRAAQTKKMTRSPPFPETETPEDREDILATLAAAPGMTYLLHPEFSPGR